MAQTELGTAKAGQKIWLKDGDPVPHCEECGDQICPHLMSFLASTVARKTENPHLPKKEAARLLGGLKSGKIVREKLRVEEPVVEAVAEVVGRREVVGFVPADEVVIDHVAGTIEIVERVETIDTVGEEIPEDVAGLVAMEEERAALEAEAEAAGTREEALEEQEPLSPVEKPATAPEDSDPVLDELAAEISALDAQMEAERPEVTEPAAQPAKAPRKKTSYGQSGPPIDDLTWDKLGADEKDLLRVLNDGQSSTIGGMADRLWSKDSAESAVKAKARSRVRNALRRTVRGNLIARVGEGEYALTEKGREQLPAGEAKAVVAA